MLCRLFPTTSSFIEPLSIRAFHSSQDLWAKRKGARILRDRLNKSRASMRKAEAPKKESWTMPLLRLDKSLLKVGNRRYSDKDKKDLPKDNVFFKEQFKDPFFSFEEAIDLHRNVLHPSMFNDPKALLIARVELNLRLKRKTRFLTPFNSMFLLPNQYDIQNSRRIVAIVPTEEMAQSAQEAGAIIAGKAEVIKMLKERSLTEVDFDFILCHTDMLIPLAEVRNVLKDHFPSKQLGNFGPDINALINKFKNGIHYKSEKDRYENDYGWVEHHIGRMDMPIEKLQENFIAFLNEVYQYKPKDTEHPFITRVLVKAPPSTESFKIPFWTLMDNDLRNPEEVEQEISDREKAKDAERRNKKTKLTNRQKELERALALQ